MCSGRPRFSGGFLPDTFHNYRNTVVIEAEAFWNIFQSALDTLVDLFLVTQELSNVLLIEHELCSNSFERLARDGEGVTANGSTEDDML